MTMTWHRTPLHTAAIDARIYVRALRLVVAAVPRESALMAVLLVVQGILPPLSVWLIKEIVDAVSASRQPSDATILVGLWGVALLVGLLASQWIMLVQANLNEQITAQVELRLMNKANQLPDLAAFEDPTFYDTLQLLTRQAPFRPMNLMVTTANMFPVCLILSNGPLRWPGTAHLR